MSISTLLSYCRARTRIFFIHPSFPARNRMLSTMLLVRRTWYTGDPWCRPSPHGPRVSRQIVEPVLNRLGSSVMRDGTSSWGDLTYWDCARPRTSWFQNSGPVTVSPAAPTVDVSNMTSVGPASPAPAKLGCSLAGLRGRVVAGSRTSSPALWPWAGPLPRSSPDSPARSLAYLPSPVSCSDGGC